MNALFDFLIGFVVGRTARNAALAAERAAWSEAQKVAYQNALAAREADQRALRDRQRPLLIVLLAIIAVVLLLGALSGS